MSIFNSIFNSSIDTHIHSSNHNTSSTTNTNPNSSIMNTNHSKKNTQYSNKIKKIVSLFLSIDHSLFSTQSFFPKQNVRSLYHLLFQSFTMKSSQKEYIRYYDELTDKVFTTSNHNSIIKQDSNVDLDEYIQLIMMNSNSDNQNHFHYCYWKPIYNNLSSDFTHLIHTFIRFVCYQRDKRIAISSESSPNSNYSLGKGFMKHSHSLLIELLHLDHSFSFLLFQVILCEFLGLYYYSSETQKYLLDELELSVNHIHLREWNRLYYYPISKNGIASWKDLKHLAHMIQKNSFLSIQIKTQALQFIVELYVKMLKRDWNLNIDQMSLCCKWIPRECSSHKFSFLYPYIVYYDKYECHLNHDRILKWNTRNHDSKKFREKISYLNVVMGTLETKMANDEFYGIRVNDLTSIQRLTHINALRNVNSQGFIRDKTRNVEGRIKCSNYFWNVTRNHYDNIGDIGLLMKMIRDILYKIERRNLLRSEISNISNKKDECWEQTSLDMIEKNRQIDELDKQIDFIDKQWFSMLNKFKVSQDKTFFIIDFIERKGEFGSFLIHSIASALINIFSTDEETVCLGVLTDALKMFTFSKSYLLSDIIQTLGNVDIIGENEVRNEMLMNLSQDIQNSFFDCGLDRLYIVLYTMFPDLYDSWEFDSESLYFVIVSMKKSKKHMSVSQLSSVSDLSSLKKKQKKRKRNNKNWRLKGLTSHSEHLYWTLRYQNPRWNYLSSILDQY